MSYRWNDIESGERPSWPGKRAGLRQHLDSGSLPAQWARTRSNRHRATLQVWNSAVSGWRESHNDVLSPTDTFPAVDLIEGRSQQNRPLKIVKVRHLRCGRVMVQLARLPLREGCVMNSLRGWRDPRTGRVFGFQSETQRENFMIGRARFCNGPNREMPRCTALNRLGEPCKAAQDARQVDLLPPQRKCCGQTGRGWPLRIFPATWTASSAPRCDQNATGCAFSGGAIRASPAGRSCWSPPMRRPVEHGQRGKVSSSMSSTAIFRRSPMRAGGSGRACRAV